MTLYLPIRLIAEALTEPPVDRCVVESNMADLRAANMVEMTRNLRNSGRIDGRILPAHAGQRFQVGLLVCGVGFTGRELRRGTPVRRVGRRRHHDSGFDPTVAKTNDALRVRRHRAFVRDDDQRMPLAMELVEQRQNFLARCRVEIARGLVGQND